jgi:hypothetical protein
VPYAPHARFTFSGIFGLVAAPSEEWVFRLNATAGGTVNQATATSLATLFGTHLAPRIGTHARLTEVKVVRIGAGGLYDGPMHLVDVNVPGTDASGVVYPYQISHAISLGTGVRGSRYRGRFYMPAPKYAVDSNEGTLTAGQADQMRTSVAAFLNAVNALPEVDRVVIASSHGFNTPVSEVRVGRVLDTIRTRRRSLPEAYTGPTQLAA